MAIVALIKANRDYAMVLILEEQKHHVVHTSRCEDAKRWRLHGTAAAAPVKRLTQSGATIVCTHTNHATLSSVPSWSLDL